MNMSFTSLLPPPKHTKQVQTKAGELHKGEEVIVNALVHNYREKNEAGRQIGELNLHIADKLSFQDIIPMRQGNFKLEIPKPSLEDITEAYNRTKKIFDGLVLKSLQPEASAIKTSREVNNKAYKIQYDTMQLSGVRKSRVLTIAEQAKDPLQPSTIKATKVVAPSEEEVAAPIYHKTDDSSLSKKLSKEEKDKWNIPAAISSWKNPKGYTIALEKRLEMDGRYSSERLGRHEVNDGFTKLSEALEAVDKKARQEIRLRAEAKRQLAEDETKRKEEKLIALARQARNERQRQYEHRAKRIRGSSPDDLEMRRDVLRKSRKQEIERDIKHAKMSTADKLRELAYSQGRDISEKVVLGAAKSTELHEVNYDSRLFSKGANAQAKSNEEQLYDQPLFVTDQKETLYRPNLQQIKSLIQDGITNDSAGSNDATIKFVGADEDSVEIGDEGR